MESNQHKPVGRRNALKVATGAGVATVATMAMSPGVAGAASPSDWYTVAPTAGDQTAQIQTALDQAFNAGGGVVYLETGEFRISNRLLLRANVTLMGAGAGTKLTASGANFAWMVQFALNSHAAVLKDMRLFGANTAGGVGLFTNGTGGFSGNDSYALVENLFIQDARTSGMRVGIGSNTREVRLHNVVVLRSKGGHGIWFDAVDSIISNCTVAGSKFDGFRIARANNRVTGCKAFFNGLNGFHVLGSRGQLSACQAQDNEGDGFRIAGAEDVALSACGADSNQFVGIRLLDCNGVSFEGASSISRGANVGFDQVFGVRIQSSQNSRITGVSRLNQVNLNVVASPTVDTSGLITP